MGTSYIHLAYALMKQVKDDITLSHIAKLIINVCIAGKWQVADVPEQMFH